MLGQMGGDIWASTFHSTCARMLRRNGERLGYTSHFTIYDTDDSRRLIKDCQKALNIDDKVLSYKSILSAISHAKDNLISPKEYEPVSYKHLKCRFFGPRAWKADGAFKQWFYRHVSFPTSRCYRGLHMVELYVSRPGKECRVAYRLFLDLESIARAASGLSLIHI